MPTILIECPYCEGGYCYSGRDPDHDRRWTCEDCNGSGSIEAEPEPRTLEDMDNEDEDMADSIGQCDCCGSYPVPVSHLVAFGIDTSACAKCRD